jgi:hypothetical protein
MLDGAQAQAVATNNEPSPCFFTMPMRPVPPQMFAVTTGNGGEGGRGGGRKGKAKERKRRKGERKDSDSRIPIAEQMNMTSRATVTNVSEHI